MSFNFVPASPLAEAVMDSEAPSTRRELEAPAAFAVRALWRERGRRDQGRHGRGTLLVSPEAIVFSPSPSTRRHTGVAEVSHTKPLVTLTCASLCPPWSNTFLVLEDGRASVRVATSGWARRRLRRALSRAGLTVAESVCRQAPELPAV